MDKEYEITEKHKKIIEKILSSGRRAEVIPVKDGVKIIKVTREEAKE